MRKFILLMAISGFLFSCNPGNESKKETKNTDSTKTTQRKEKVNFSTCSMTDVTDNAETMIDSFQNHKALSGNGTCYATFDTACLAGIFDSTSVTDIQFAAAEFLSSSPDTASEPCILLEATINNTPSNDIYYNGMALCPPPTGACRTALQNNMYINNDTTNSFFLNAISPKIAENMIAFARNHSRNPFGKIKVRFLELKNAIKAHSITSDTLFLATEKTQNNSRPGIMLKMNYKDHSRNPEYYFRKFE